MPSSHAFPDGELRLALASSLCLIEKAGAAAVAQAL